MSSPAGEPRPVLSMRGDLAGQLAIDGARTKSGMQHARPGRSRQPKSLPSATCISRQPVNLEPSSLSLSAWNMLKLSSKATSR